MTSVKQGHYEGFPTNSFEKKKKENSFDGRLPGHQLMVESHPSLYPLTATLLRILGLGASAKNCGHPGPKLFSLNSGAMASCTAYCSFFAPYLVKCTSYVIMM